jgi:2-polyprenyl-3-methyl-5-hydroxy-6-metoxy-1,4-benzoquinol methylase
MAAVNVATGHAQAGYVLFDPRPWGTHAKLDALVPAGSRVLDAGCSTGYLAEQLAQRQCEIVGLELDPAAAEVAEQICERVLVGDVERMELPFEPNEFDVVLGGDIIEHLRDPQAALARLRPFLRPGGRLVLSTPNIANWAIRLSLLAGRFDYTDRGLLDRTHTHLFTRRSLLRCIEGAGYRLVSLDYSVPLPQPVRAEASEALAHRVAGLRPTLFAYQWVLAAEPA